MNPSLNKINTNLGAPFVPFTRLLPAEYDDAESLPRGGLTSSTLPSPRKVSTTVHQVIKTRKEQIKFSQMVMQFGQFLDHDLTLTPEQERDCLNPDVLSRDKKEDWPEPELSDVSKQDRDLMVLRSGKNEKTCVELWEEWMKSNYQDKKM